MKRHLLLLGFLVLCFVGKAQTAYKYVIVPTRFAEFTDDLNPYGLSAALQKEFTDKGIRSEFQSDQVADDYCDALTVNLVKVQHLFRNKLKVELLDCRNRVVWSEEGTGHSKEFREGYAEAVADAMKDLEKLPLNPLAGQVAGRTTPVAVPVAQAETAPSQAVVSTPVQAPKVVSQQAPRAEVKRTVSLYRPANLYYNYTYFVDLVEKDNGQKALLVVNGKLLGYDELQVIAELEPTGLEQVFTVEWIKPNGSAVRGVANLTEGELTLSLPGDDGQEVIRLQRY